MNFRVKKNTTIHDVYCITPDWSVISIRRINAMQYYISLLHYLNKGGINMETDIDLLSLVSILFNFVPDHVAVYWMFLKS